MKITVKYFAMLRETTRKTSEVVDAADNETAATLFARLAKEYRFPIEFKDVQVAINAEFAAAQTQLRANDEVAYIPPVCGG